MPNVRQLVLAARKAVGERALALLTRIAALGHPTNPSGNNRSQR